MHFAGKLLVAMHPLQRAGYLFWLSCARQSRRLAPFVKEDP
jgi:hypothetical protein